MPFAPALPEGVEDDCDDCCDDPLRMDSFPIRVRAADVIEYSLLSSATLVPSAVAGMVMPFPRVQGILPGHVLPLYANFCICNVREKQKNINTVERLKNAPRHVNY